MHDSEFNGVSKTLQRGRKLPTNRRSTRIIGKNTADYSERNRATNAANVERLQEYRVKGAGGASPALLTYIPAKLQSAVEAIESVIDIVAPYEVDDIGDWVTCTVFTGAENVEEVATAAADIYGGCPAAAIYAHFNIRLDPQRLLIKPPQIGDWCIIQCFRSVSLYKLQLVQQLTTAYWPSRKLHFVAARKQFEASACMFDFIEKVHFDESTMSNSFSLKHALDDLYQTHRDQFTGLTRFSTEGVEDYVDHIRRLGQS